MRGLGVLDYMRTGSTTILVRVPIGSQVTVPSRFEKFGLQVKPSRFTHDSLAKLEDLISKTHEESRGLSAFGMEYVVESDAVVVAGSITDEFRAFLSSLGDQIVVKGDHAAKRQGRYDDTRPHYGGAAASSATQPRCTTGFAVTGSTQFMATAGHCFRFGEATHAAGVTGADRDMGTVTRRAAFPARDMELLSGTIYDGRAWTGPQAQPQSDDIINARDATIGTQLCISGTSTYLNCGKIVRHASDARFCDEAGCTRYLTSMNGGNETCGGDSGAPVLAMYPNGTDAGVQGLFIAADGVDVGGGCIDGTYFAHWWASIIDEYPGLQIRTSS